MSEKMRPISFDGLMRRALGEYRESGTIFGVRRLYRHTSDKALPIFGERLETPFGPAAGPHTQLAQNLIAAYAGGSRFFELKTVQTLDGDDLPVSKPCILAREEGFNVEWSTELTVPQAMDEYIKAWFAIKLLSREFSLGSDTGFVFNMSVGYDLKGIQSPKIDLFIESLKDASHTQCFADCTAWALDSLSLFEHIDEAFVRSISPRVCRSITLSTLHGCPAGEIERIAAYLIGEKGLNTYVKCNPTLLGYQFARRTLDKMGYDGLVFDDHHFKDDLQFDDAVPMFTRLQDIANEHGVEFGLKLSNTFPVQIVRGELPGDEMYMSGMGLYPLTAPLAQKIETAFDGKLRISYSGGADAMNVKELFACHIWPITMATTFLKPGGYNRMKPIADALIAQPYQPFDGVDEYRLHTLVTASTQDRHHIKPLKELPSRKLDTVSPITDCFVAPCEQGCPIHQDIAAYMDLAAEGRCTEALEVIYRKNPLPFITGTICPHRCQTQCTRHFYEDSVHIREAKLYAADLGFDEFAAALKAPMGKRTEHIAVIGGGPAGMAAACFAARAGARVTLFEKRGDLGGVVRYVIPSFRINDEMICRDTELLLMLGVDIRLNAEIEDVSMLWARGYTHAVLATGAWEPSGLRLEAGGCTDALEFLKNIKENGHAYDGIRHAVVVGGGNTAMDTARAAARIRGVESVSVVYRRTKREMPADEEELALAMEDGISFHELRNPIKLENGVLTLAVMALGERDASGRRSPAPTDETCTIACDLLLSATGEKPDAAYLASNGVVLDERGHAQSIRQSDRLWLIGDAYSGPATVVQAIASAREAISDMLGLTSPARECAHSDSPSALETRGDLTPFTSAQDEASRCLHCGEICENCVDVCPNRANVAIRVEGCKQPQIVHIDAMCNECGNCAAFCPYQGAPYRDKLTAFDTPELLRASESQGFAPLAGGRVLVRLSGAVYEDDTEFTRTDEGLQQLLKAAWKLAAGLR